MIDKPSLAWLLHPISLDQFLGTIWGKKHHHIRREQPGYFSGIISASQLEDYLNTARPPIPAVRLIKGKESIAPDSFRFSSGELNLVRIRNEFVAGYSIIINGLEQYCPPISAITHMIEFELNFESQINAYITPQSSQAFHAHFDDHDVIIMQIEGSKTWYLYEGIDVMPRDFSCRDTFPENDLPTPLTLRLEAGDVLYVPRGMVHAAQANEAPSIHLTVGIHAPTIKSLLMNALEALSLRDNRPLERLPPRALDDPVVRDCFGDRVRDVISAMGDPDVIADGWGAVQDALIRRGRCHSVGQLVANAVDANRVNSETLVAKYWPLYSRVLATDKGVALQFGQSLVSADASHRAAMLFLSKSASPFKVCELPDLNAAEQIELARKLIIDGFLVKPSMAEQGMMSAWP